MSDNENTTYWTEFTNEELESKNPFSKGVRKGNVWYLSIYLAQIFMYHSIQCNFY